MVWLDAWEIDGRSISEENSRWLFSIQHRKKQRYRNERIIARRLFFFDFISISQGTFALVVALWFYSFTYSMNPKSIVWLSSVENDQKRVSLVSFFFYLINSQETLISTKKSIWVELLNYLNWLCIHSAWTKYNDLWPRSVYRRCWLGET